MKPKKQMMSTQLFHKQMLLFRYFSEQFISTKPFPYNRRSRFHTSGEAASVMTSGASDENIKKEENHNFFTCTSCTSHDKEKQLHTFFPAVSQSNLCFTRHKYIHAIINKYIQKRRSRFCIHKLQMKTTKYDQ